MNLKHLKGHGAMLSANILFGGMAPVSKSVLMSGNVNAYDFPDVGGCASFLACFLFPAGGACKP